MIVDRIIELLSVFTCPETADNRITASLLLNVQFSSIQRHQGTNIKAVHKNMNLSNENISTQKVNEHKDHKNVLIT